MFTGLIESLGKIVGSEQTDGGTRLTIATPLAPELALGESLAVNGVCLTVVAADTSAVQADVGPETLRVTTLGDLRVHHGVNLERSMRADSRFGGHFVQGHVDAVGRIEAVSTDGEFLRLSVSYPPRFAAHLIHRGSIAIDGISLTVAGLSADSIELMIIPFTASHTTLRQAAVGTRVNLEFDVIGKYVARATELAGLATPGSSPHASSQTLEAPASRSAER